MPLTDYLTQMQAAFSEAVRFQSVCEHTIQIADLTIRLRFAGPALEPMVLPALAHLEKEDIPGSPKITFHLWDAATTGVNPPRPPFASDDYHRYGQRAMRDDGEQAIMHAPGNEMIFAYDRTRRKGYFWTKDAGQLSIYERAAPVQTLFHWALREFGWQIVHGAAVGTEAGGVLLVGNSGAGKSTTALSCLGQPNLHFLSDDKCLVRLQPHAQAFSIFSSGKIKADMLDHLPHFRGQLQGWDDNFKAGKGLVFLHPEYQEQMIHSFPIKALVIPQVTHLRHATIHPVRASEVFRVLGPSTAIWLPGAEAGNYRFTAALTRQLPCFRLNLAKTPQANADAICRLIETF